jgi:peptide/nickel transport system permease protein
VSGAGPHGGAAAAPGWRGWLAAAWDGDVAWSFRRSPVAIASGLVLALCLAGALLAPWIAPHNPFDLRTLDLKDALLPPAWQDGGQAGYALGTDDQGRDVLSAIMFGARISLLVGLASVALAVVTGVALGLVAGYVGGRVDAFIMRVADVQLSFPAILIALLIDGVARAALPRDVHSGVALLVLVLATINIATAIVTEATLSFLGVGVGVPPTQPSLGTLIRVGNDFLFSGEWWITIFPGVTLVVMVLSINLLGDWLRDALNPKLR